MDDLEFINSHRKALGYKKFKKLSKEGIEKHLKLIAENAPFGNDPWLPNYVSIWWDWKEQAPISLFTKAAKSGLVYFNEVDSDGDYYLVIASDHKLTKEEIDAVRRDDESTA